VSAPKLPWRPSTAGCRARGRAGGPALAGPRRPPVGLGGSAPRGL